MSSEDKNTDQAAERAAEEAVEEVQAEVIDQDQEAPEESEASAETNDSADADSEQPNVFDAIKQEVTELRDRYARLQAEWDNYRKRTASEREAERARASEKLVVDLLPVLDDLERAIKHAKDTGEGGNLTEGVEAVQTKFLQILGKHKVEQVKAQDEPFDAMQHQAVGTQEDADVPEETVVQVYQQGYTMGEKVLRPAMVVTSVGGPARKADDESAE